MCTYGAVGPKSRRMNTCKKNRGGGENSASHDPGVGRQKGVLRAKVMGIRSFRALTKSTPLLPHKEVEAAFRRASYGLGSNACKMNTYKPGSGTPL